MDILKFSTFEEFFFLVYFNLLSLAKVKLKNTIE